MKKKEKRIELVLAEKEEYKKEKSYWETKGKETPSKFVKMAFLYEEEKVKTWIECLK
jgi:hypothetical protein